MWDGELEEVWVGLEVGVEDGELIDIFWRELSAIDGQPVEGAGLNYRDFVVVGAKSNGMAQP